VINLVKNVVKNVPIVGSAILKMRHYFDAKTLQRRAAVQIFTDYYRANKWRDESSRSGGGSNLAATSEIRPHLPPIWRKLNARIILDVPCGDFHWMNQVDLGEFEYIGADIVAEMIAENRRRFSRPGVSFRTINLLQDELPQAELVFCRDCLVHFSYADIVRALANIRASGAKWLMMTNFPVTGTNIGIATGQWRPLNFETAPFNFPPPCILLRELLNPDLLQSWPDKSLAVWAVSELPICTTAYR
jgi:hypothetical protein